MTQDYTAIRRQAEIMRAVYIRALFVRLFRRDTVRGVGAQHA
jgi:hypothetical protein